MEMAAPVGRDGGRGLWCYHDQIGSISSSGTVSTTAYTSSGSHQSWISMEAAMHLEKKDTEFVQPAKMFPANWKKMEHIEILAKEFFCGPSAKGSIEGADMSVLERWLIELDVGWVLHLADGAPTGKRDQTLDASSWIRALTEIMDTLCLMTSLFPGHDSVEDQGSGTESEEQYYMTEQAQFATFTQQALLKLLAFVDFTDAPLSLTCEVVVPAPYQKLHALLHVRDTLSKALSEIRLPFDSSPSAEVKKILGEIDSVLSAKDGKVGEAIWTEVQEIGTRILESMGDAKDSCHTQTIRELSGIHKATYSVIAYVWFLLLDGSSFTKYSSVVSVVSEAARSGKYVPQIGGVSPLRSLVLEMISCAQEKLANKSEALFPDQSLRFLFLFNNSSYIRDRLPYDIPKSYEEALAGKVDGYMESYIQASWAPVLVCLLNPTPRRLGKRYSPLPKFESEFQKAYTTQKLWKVPDPRLRKTLREAIIEKIIPGYTKYIEENKVLTTPKFTPQNLEEMLQELFKG